jgi:hypothetical protein
MSDVPYDPQAFTTAHAKIASAPETLTTTDLRILQAFSSRELAATAARARWKALEPLPVPSAADAPASSTPQAALLDAVAAVLVDSLRDALTPMQARLDALDARVLDLEAAAAARSREPV